MRFIEKVGILAGVGIGVYLIARYVMAKQRETTKTPAPSPANITISTERCEYTVDEKIPIKYSILDNNGNIINNTLHAKIKIYEVTKGYYYGGYEVYGKTYYKGYVPGKNFLVREEIIDVSGSGTINITVDRPGVYIFRLCVDNTCSKDISVVVTRKPMSTRPPIETTPTKPIITIPPIETIPTPTPSKPQIRKLFGENKHPVVI